MSELKMCECGEPTYTDKCELCFIDDAVKQDITRSLPMNARIKELTIRELAWSVGIAGKNGKGQIDTDWDHLEKFAELLVKECIKQVEQSTASPFVSLDNAIRMSHFVAITKNKIVKHFGIK